MEKKKLSKKNKKIIVALVLVIAVIVGICVVVFKPEEKLKVETTEVSVQTIKETLDTSGTVASVSQDAFSLPSGVKIDSLNVKEGDKVKTGDIIATFDLTSLDAALSDKQSAYNKAADAYKTSQQTAVTSKSKISQVKKQIAELEREVERLKKATDVEPNKNVPENNSNKVSDSMIQRFVRVAKLFGYEYSKDEAAEILSGFIKSGSSTNDLSSLIENLTTLSGANGSFDFSSLSSMTGSSELMSAEMSLIQLKAQLATLELQADDTYVSTFKAVADKTKESYLTAKAQIDSMRNGWIAKNDGIVVQVNVDENGTFLNENANSSVDISSVLSAVTTGGDVTSLLSSFLGQDNVAVKVLYYPLVVDVSLSKYDVLDVSLNQEVIVKPASGNELNGKVSYISAVATSSNGLDIGSIMGSSSASSVIPAQVTIENADSSVIVGVDVQVSIITDTIENAVVVPVEAICIDGEEVFVYVLEDGKAVKRDVELGISSDTHYQILSGVTKEDVLIKNTFGLEEGVSVET